MQINLQNQNTVNTLFWFRHAIYVITNQMRLETVKKTVCIIKRVKQLRDHATVAYGFKKSPRLNF